MRVPTGDELPVKDNTRIGYQWNNAGNALWRRLFGDLIGDNLVVIHHWDDD